LVRAPGCGGSPHIPTLHTPSHAPGQVVWVPVGATGVILWTDMTTNQVWGFEHAL
jgi:hypothetical protein